jgi:CheY-like chemotaxis protein
MVSYRFQKSGATLFLDYSGPLVDVIQPPLPGCEKAVSDMCFGVVIDMSKVDYIDSYGVSSLQENCKYLKSNGINVVVCSLSPNVQRIVKLACTDVALVTASDKQHAKEMLFHLANDKKDFPREHILVVNGQLNIHENLKKVLAETMQENNYNVITALNLERAKKVLANGRIQLVLIDITIPINDGHNFVKEMKISPENNYIPVLIASDEHNLPDAAYYVKNGADDIIRYPFNRFESPSRLRNALMLYYLQHPHSENGAS